MLIKNISTHMIANLAPGQTREVRGTPRKNEDGTTEPQDKADAREIARVKGSAAFRAGHLVEGNQPMPAVMYRPLPSADDKDSLAKALGLVSMETDPQVLARWAQDTESSQVREAIRLRQESVMSTPRTSTNEGPPVVPQRASDAPGTGAPVPPPPPPPPPPPGVTVPQAPSATTGASKVTTRS